MENILDTFLEYAKFGFNMCVFANAWMAFQKIQKFQDSSKPILSNALNFQEGG